MSVMYTTWRMFICVYMHFCVCVFVRMRMRPIASMVVELEYLVFLLKGRDVLARKSIEGYFILTGLE